MMRDIEGNEFCLDGRTIINTATHGSRIVTGGDGMTAGDDIHNTTYDSPAPGAVTPAPSPIPNDGRACPSPQASTQAFRLRHRRTDS
ncbi:hypothetical protein ACWEPH_17625 [Nocardia beijingensis]